MQVKSRIDALLLRVHQEEQALLAGLSERERAATGSPDEMSAKDILAHVMAAKQREAHQLAALAQGETTGNDAHDDAQVFAHYQNCSWQEVQGEAERIFTLFVAQVDNFTEEDLLDPQRYASIRGKPLSSQILIYGAWHPTGHLVEFYRRRGDGEHARHIYETLLEVLSQPDMAPAMHGDGINLYNLACAYAVMGQTDKALALLPEALRLDPELVEESKHDPDLDTLRVAPAFQALYTT